MMSNIKSEGTKPERLVEREMRRLGIRYKRQDRVRPGRPDLVFVKAKLAVFVDGNFFHGHPHYPLPKSNVEFWSAKIARNRRRDKTVNARLNRMGWHYLRLWESDIMRSPEIAGLRIKRALDSIAAGKGAHAGAGRACGESHHRWSQHPTVMTGHKRAQRLYPTVQPCEVCGSPRSERHHKNGNTADNRRRNIAWLCRKHHIAEDRLELLQERCRKMAKAAALIRWGKAGPDACREAIAS